MELDLQLRRFCLERGSNSGTQNQQASTSRVPKGQITSTIRGCWGNTSKSRKQLKWYCLFIIFSSKHEFKNSLLDYNIYNNNIGIRHVH